MHLRLVILFALRRLPIMLRLSRLPLRSFGASARQVKTGFRATLLLGAAVAALAPLPAHADSGSVIGLGSLGGSYSGNPYVFVSENDGSVVVGQSNLTGDTASRAFRWSKAGGMVALGTLGGTNSNSGGVSADGGVVVGSAQL